MAQPNIAYNGEGIDIGFVAGVDLSTKQFYLVKVDTSTGYVVLGSSAGEKCIGVLQNAPKSGQAALVRVLGVTKVAVGAAFSAPGSYVKTTTAGKADVAGSGAFPVGQLLTTAASGDYATMHVNPGYVALA